MAPAGASTAAPLPATQAEQQQVLRDCWGAWCGLASAGATAHRAAELRGAARAEDFREAQLARLCFRAWRGHRLQVTASVLARMGSAAQRHAFVKWRAAAREGRELGRRACLHYNSVSMKAALQVGRRWLASLVALAASDAM